MRIRRSPLVVWLLDGWTITEVATFGLEALSGRGPGGLECLQGYSRFPLLVERAISAGAATVRSLT